MAHMASKDLRMTIFVVQKECHSSVLLPLYSNRIIQTTNGRSEIGKYFTELCQKIKETKPSMVIKYGKQAFWVMCKDRSCTPEMNELGQSKFVSQTKPQTKPAFTNSLSFVRINGRFAVRRSK